MKVIYWGIFVQDDRFITSLEKPIQYMHVTFGFKSKVPTDILGETVEVSVIGYANDGKNEAYLVEVPEKYTPYVTNPRKRILHITTSISSSARPVDSNNLNFEPIDKPFTVTGRFGFYGDDKVIHYVQ